MSLYPEEAPNSQKLKPHGKQQKPTSTAKPLCGDLVRNGLLGLFSCLLAQLGQQLPPIHSRKHRVPPHTSARWERVILHPPSFSLQQDKVLGPLMLSCQESVLPFPLIAGVPGAFKPCCPFFERMFPSRSSPLPTTSIYVQAVVILDQEALQGTGAAIQLGQG